MITISLEFQNIDTAIVALAKLGGMNPKAAAPSQVNAGVQATGGSQQASRKADAAAPVEAATAPKRRGRPPKNAAALIPAAGKPAGDALTSQGEALVAVAPQQTAPQGVSGSAPDSQPPAVAVHIPAPDAVQQALEKVFAVQGINGAQTLLSSFGAQRLRDLRPEQYGEFLIAAEALTPVEAA